MVNFLEHHNRTMKALREAYAYKKVQPATVIEIPTPPVSHTTKALEETAGLAIWDVLVTSWGGDAAKAINGITWERDLGGDYFYPDYTDFGDSAVQTLKGFYEHSTNSLVNPMMPENQQLLGKATLVKTDDWGRWWQFEIDRTLPYYEYLESLKSLGLLGASTQAYFGGVTREEDGRLKRWWESEVSLTPTPLDPSTLTQVYDAAKSYGIPFSEHEYQKALAFMKTLSTHMKRSVSMPKTLVKNEADETILENDASTATTNDTVATEGTVGEEQTTVDSVDDVQESEETSEAEEGSDFAESMKTLFNKGEDTDDNIKGLQVVPTITDLDIDVQALESAGVESLLKTLILSTIQVNDNVKALSSFVSGYVDMWGSLEDLPDLVTALGSIQQATSKTLKVTTDTQKGLQHFAEGVAENMQIEVKTVVSETVEKAQKSNVEREVDDEQTSGFVSPTRKNAPKFPANAPGG